MTVGIIYTDETKSMLDRFFMEQSCFTYYKDEYGGYEAYRSTCDTYELYSVEFARNYQRSGIYLEMSFYPCDLKDDVEMMEMLQRCTRANICPQADVLIRPYGEKRKGA